MNSHAVFAGNAQANEAQVLIPIDQAEELFGIADPEQTRGFPRS
jgi:hypothetical protein